MDADIVVLGARMAGLTCARALAERGSRVVSLEARNRVGGRVLTHHGVELGAEFVHGRAVELWALMEECDVTAVEREGTILRENWAGGLEEDDPQDKGMFEPLEKLVYFTGEDLAFADWIALSDVPEDKREALVGYVEGFNAADAKRIGVKALGMQQKAEDAIEGKRTWHVQGGYAQLAEYLAARVKELGGEVRLGWEALTVRWREGYVGVETNRGVVHATKCVVTLPLGVLQCVNDEGALRMIPEPAAIAMARRMEMGCAARFTMVFRERWWEQAAVLEKKVLEEMSFLFTPQREVKVWWTTWLEESTMLTGWVGGPQAKELAGKSAGIMS